MPGRCGIRCRCRSRHTPLPSKPGATLRSVARDLAAAGIIPADWVLVGLARAAGVDRAIKAGNYEIASGTTLMGLLSKLTQGDVTQTGFTIVEGWNMRDLRAALKKPIRRFGRPSPIYPMTP